MKIAANNTSQTIVLLGGKLHLFPKGDLAGRDRFPLQDRWLADETLQRFAKLGKITIEDSNVSAKPSPNTTIQKTESTAAPQAESAPSFVSTSIQPALKDTTETESRPEETVKRERKRRR